MNRKRNRTSKYLSQILNKFGKVFINEFMSLTSYSRGVIGESVICYSICDIMYMRAKKINAENFKDYLFIVVDFYGINREGNYLNKEEGITRFLNFLSFSRKSTYYVDDYHFDVNQHCFVFKFPTKYVQSYRHFLTSKYGSMYSLEQLAEIGITPHRKKGNEKFIDPTYLVMTRDPKGIEVLKKAILDNYGTTQLPDNITEYDIPWLIKDEVLNNQYMNESEKETFKLIKNEHYEKTGVAQY